MVRRGRVMVQPRPILPVSNPQRRIITIAEVLPKEQGV